MTEGFYTYSVLQDGLGSDVIETGKLLIKANEDTVQIITPIRKEEYMIYR